MSKTIICTNCELEAGFVVFINDSTMFALCEKCRDNFELTRDAAEWSLTEYAAYIRDVAYDMGISISKDQALWIADTLDLYVSLEQGIRKTAEGTREAQLEAWADLQMDR